MASTFAIIVGLAAVLCSAALFTNALEWFGVRAGVSHGTLGSVFAAIGTALPETTVAVLAVAGGAGAARDAGDAVGIGAILGAPLLLSTLGFALLGGGTLRRGNTALKVPPTVPRDLGFFLVTFGSAVALGTFAPGDMGFWRLPIALGLLASYAVFLVSALAADALPEAGHAASGGGVRPAGSVTRPRPKASGAPLGSQRKVASGAADWPVPGSAVPGARVPDAHLPTAPHGVAGGPASHSLGGDPGSRSPAGRPAPLLLIRRLGGGDPGWAAIGLQIAMAIGLMLAGAEMFVATLTGLSLRLGLSGFVLAALVAPLATELPETANSLVWARQGKDALAAGNVTGAMVLQGSVVPAVGILFTPWHFTTPEWIGALCGLVGPAAAYLACRATGRLPAWLLLGGALVYISYVAYLL